MGGGAELAHTSIVVVSEFGRTAKQNGTGGTDHGHGHGNVIWLLGGGVAGGKVHGTWPGLDDAALHENRDLAITTDFHSVLGSVLGAVCEQHLGLDDAGPATVLSGAPASMPALFEYAPSRSKARPGL